MPIKKKVTVDNDFNALHISDIHFGKFDDAKLYEEYKEVVLKSIETNNHIDVVFISGDYFDKECKLSDLASIYAMTAMADTVALCEKHNIQIRLLRGTITHDFSQCRIFKYLYERPGSIFRYIETACVEELYEGFKILYLPEEYPEDYREYYRDLVYEAADNAYDYVIFHGTFDFQAFVAQKQEGEKHINSAVVWSSDDIIRICKGFTIGGHIHTHSSMKNKVFYTGSLSRRNHGEMAAKGILFSSYVAGSEDNFVSMIENTLAPRYETMEFEGILNKFESFKDAVKAIHVIAEKRPDVFIRFEISRSYADANLEKVRILNSTFHSNPRITFKQSAKLKAKKETAVEADTVNGSSESPHEVAEKDKYMWDDGLSEVQKLSIFIKQKFEYELPPERINEILYTTQQAPAK